MDAAQASNLAGTTAAAITSSQEAAMSGSVRLAIYNARSGELRNSASGESPLQVMVPEASRRGAFLVDRCVLERFKSRAVFLLERWASYC